MSSTTTDNVGDESWRKHFALVPMKLSSPGSSPAKDVSPLIPITAPASTFLLPTPQFSSTVVSPASAASPSKSRYQEMYQNLKDADRILSAKIAASVSADKERLSRVQQHSTERALRNEQSKIQGANSEFLRARDAERRQLRQEAEMRENRRRLDDDLEVLANKIWVETGVRPDLKSSSNSPSKEKLLAKSSKVLRSVSPRRNSPRRSASPNSNLSPNQISPTRGFSKASPSKSIPVGGDNNQLKHRRPCDKEGNRRLSSNVGNNNHRKSNIANGSSAPNVTEYQEGAFEMDDRGSPQRQGGHREHREGRGVFNRDEDLENVIGDGNELYSDDEWTYGSGSNYSGDDGSWYADDDNSVFDDDGLPFKHAKPRSYVAPYLSGKSPKLQTELRALAHNHRADEERLRRGLSLRNKEERRLFNKAAKVEAAVAHQLAQEKLSSNLIKIHETTVNLLDASVKKHATDVKNRIETRQESAARDYKCFAERKVKDQFLKTREDMENRVHERQDEVDAKMYALQREEEAKVANRTKEILESIVSFDKTLEDRKAEYRAERLDAARTQLLNKYEREVPTWSMTTAELTENTRLALISVDLNDGLMQNIKMAMNETANGNK